MNILSIYNILTPTDKELLRALLNNEGVDIKTIDRLPSQSECDKRVIDKMNKRRK